MRPRSGGTNDMDIIKIIVVICTMGTTPIGQVKSGCRTLEGTTPIAGRVVSEVCQQAYDSWIAVLKKKGGRLEDFKCFLVQSSH